MEELRAEIERKRALMEKIIAQMGDLTLYSVKTQRYLELVGLSLAGAEVALEHSDLAKAIYYYGRACSNIGALTDRGREEKQCREQPAKSSSTPESSTTKP